jgi:hypothetical protein
MTLSIFQMMVGNDGEFVSNAEKLQNVNEIQNFWVRLLRWARGPIGRRASRGLGSAHKKRALHPARH